MKGLGRLAGLIRREAPLLAFWAAVIVYYVFVISAGHFTYWHVWSAAYDTQAEALVAGHLHLLEEPTPALLALKDPYDIANIDLWRWDHLLYKGHLYHYWGIVPAFLVAALKLVVPGGWIGDNGLTFAFLIVRLVIGTLLIRDIARRAARPPARWIVAAAMLVFALANPTPYSLARGAIYEAAIMAGVAFMTMGLYFGHRAVLVRGDGAATAWLAAASLSFGLAAGSRLNLAPTAGALAALTALWRWWPRRAEGKGRLAVTAAAGLVPAGAVMFGLLIINKLRFDHWTDFGRQYAMTYPLFVPGLRFLLPNAYAYAFAPPEWDCSFPYLSLGWNAVRLLTPGWLPVTWPADHHSPEPTVGLLAIAPFFGFALLAPLIPIARARLRAAAAPPLASVSAPVSASVPNGWAALLARRNWLWVALAVYVLGSTPLLLLNVTTMRYEHDFATALLLVAIIAAWKLLAAPLPRAARLALAWLYGMLAVWTIVGGVLFGFTGYFEHFAHHNPALMRALQDNLSFCHL